MKRLLIGLFFLISIASFAEEKETWSFPVYFSWDYSDSIMHLQDNETILTKKDRDHYSQLNQEDFDDLGKFVLGFKKKLKLKYEENLFISGGEVYKFNRDKEIQKAGIPAPSAYIKVLSGLIPNSVNEERGYAIKYPFSPFCLLKSRAGRGEETILNHEKIGYGYFVSVKGRKVLPDYEHYKHFRPERYDVLNIVGQYRTSSSIEIDCYAPVFGSVGEAEVEKILIEIFEGASSSIWKLDELKITPFKHKH